MTAAPARPPRRRRRWLLVAVTIVAGLWWWIGFTSTVTPPSTLREPVTVMLIRDQLHRGVLLPGASGAGFVEFGVGDWSWYALGREAWYDTFATVLWPTQATLSRRLHRGRDAAAVRAAKPWASFAELQVERADADRLRQRLEAAFAAGAAQRVRSEPLDMEFVPGGETWPSYWFAANCADACAMWFEELGCGVSWVPLRVDLTVAPK
ncbi:MAG: hypothetical protein R3F29_00110 [Planctomycetota bacterium]